MASMPRFGVFTDIYALGATTYHLLTGQVPIQATDRAAGVELRRTETAQCAVSRQVSDAVMWAMEMRVDKRPQSAPEFVQAMQGARSASSNGSAKGAASTAQAAPNPYQGRIEQLLAELESLTAPAHGAHPGSSSGVVRSSYESQISDIKRKLEEIRGSLNLHITSLPMLPEFHVAADRGREVADVPRVFRAQMMIKKLDQKLCPVCREGHIAPTKLESQMMFCPVCRSRSLREDKRKRFGLAIDRWWVCPGCSAEFDVLLGGRAKLENAGSDPLGVGKDYLGETLSIAAWQQLAPLSGVVWTCDGCAAQFYELGDSRLALIGRNVTPMA